MSLTSLLTGRGTEMRTESQIKKQLNNGKKCVTLLQRTYFADLRPNRYVTKCNNENVIAKYKSLDDAIDDIEYRYGSKWEYNCITGRIHQRGTYYLRHGEMSPMNFQPIVKKG